MGKQVAALGVEQEQQPVEQRQRRLETSASSSSVGLPLRPSRPRRSARKPWARCGKIVTKIRSLSRSPSRLA